MPWLLSVTTAEPAEQTPSDDEDRSGGPADEEGGPQLSFLTCVDRWVVEVPDDVVGHPAHWNQNEDPGQDKEDSGNSHEVCLCPPVRACALNLLHATDANKQSNHRQGHSHTHEGPGCLQGRREGQQRIIELALQLILGLSDAVHPEAFPDPFEDNYVAANKSRHSPLRQKSCGKGPDHAEEPKNQSSDLQWIKCHRLCSED